MAFNEAWEMVAEFHRRFSHTVQSKPRIIASGRARKKALPDGTPHYNDEGKPIKPPQWTDPYKKIQSVIAEWKMVIAGFVCNSLQDKEIRLYMRAPWQQSCIALP
jgi:hypothetical protein